jgi:uncharacterized protein
MRNIFAFWAKQTIIQFIRLYQKTLSPDHGWMRVFHPHGYCRFRPTCSEYAIQASNEHGVLKGVIKAMWRILRCNPWNEGGWDPVDKKK